MQRLKALPLLRHLTRVYFPKNILSIQHGTRKYFSAEPTTYKTLAERSYNSSPRISSGLNANVNRQLSDLLRENKFEEAELFFLNMEKDHKISPDLRTYMTMLNHYKRQDQLPKMILLLEDMKKKGIKLNITIYWQLLNQLSKSGDIAQMKVYFHDMQKEGIVPTVVMFNQMLEAYHKNGDRGGQTQLVSQMLKHNVKPGIFVML